MFSCQEGMNTDISSDLFSNYFQNEALVNDQDLNSSLLLISKLSPKDYSNFELEQEEYIRGVLTEREVNSNEIHEIIEEHQVLKNRINAISQNLYSKPFYKLSNEELLMVVEKYDYSQLDQRSKKIKTVVAKNCPPTIVSNECILNEFHKPIGLFQSAHVKVQSITQAQGCWNTQSDNGQYQMFKNCFYVVKFQQFGACDILKCFNQATLQLVQLHPYPGNSNLYASTRLDNGSLSLALNKTLTHLIVGSPQVLYHSLGAWCGP